MKYLFAAFLITLITSYQTELNGKELPGGCPAGWVCPSTPIYTSKIGAWYSLYWNQPGSAYNHWPEWTRYKPLLGYYGSGNPSVVATHFSQMKAAGIEYVIFDHTNGIGNDGGTIEQNARSIVATNANLGESAQLKFSFAIGYGLWGATSVSAQNAEADHIWNYYSNDPRHYTINGRPLMVLYNSIESENCFGCNWNDSRFTVRRAGGMIDGKNPVLQKYAAEGIWGWVIKSPQIASPEAITIMPGWDTKHLGRATTPIERAQGAYYIAQWLFAIKNNPRNIVIASWNDWAEETSIEPAVSVTGPKWTDSYGTEVPDYYLQITSAYGNLRRGLMPGYYYRDEDNASVYLVSDGKLIPQGAMPRGRPVIFLPSGTIAKLLALTSGPVEEMIPAGLFKVGYTIGYSKGESYCLFDSMVNFTAITGKSDASGIASYPSIPSSMKSEGICVNAKAPSTEIIPEGLFKVGYTLGYSNGVNAYCLFDSMANFTKLTGKKDANGIKNYETLPTKMSNHGVCRGN